MNDPCPVDVTLEVVGPEPIDLTAEVGTIYFVPSAGVADTLVRAGFVLMEGGSVELSDTYGVYGGSGTITLPEITDDSTIQEWVISAFNGPITLQPATGDALYTLSNTNNGDDPFEIAQATVVRLLRYANVWRIILASPEVTRADLEARRNPHTVGGFVLVSDTFDPTETPTLHPESAAPLYVYTGTPNDTYEFTGLWHGHSDGVTPALMTPDPYTVGTSDFYLCRLFMDATGGWVDGFPLPFTPGNEIPDEVLPTAWDPDKHRFVVGYVSSNNGPSAPVWHLPWEYNWGSNNFAPESTDLADFDTNPPSLNGHVPVWDSALGKYVPGPATPTANVVLYVPTFTTWDEDGIWTPEVDDVMWWIMQSPGHIGAGDGGAELDNWASLTNYSVTGSWFVDNDPVSVFLLLPGDEWPSVYAHVDADGFHKVDMPAGSLLLLRCGGAPLSVGSVWYGDNSIGVIGELDVAAVATSFKPAGVTADHVLVEDLFNVGRTLTAWIADNTPSSRAGFRTITNLGEIEWDDGTVGFEDGPGSSIGLPASDSEHAGFKFLVHGPSSGTATVTDDGSTIRNLDGTVAGGSYTIEANAWVLFGCGPSSYWYVIYDSSLVGSGGGVSPTFADSAPSSPSAGDLWVRTTDMVLFTYYDSTWIALSGSGGGGGTGLDVIIVTAASTGATEALDLASGRVFDITLDQNCTFSFTNPDTGTATAFTVILSGAFTPTWPGSVIWPGGIEPTYTAPSIYTFLSIDDGTTWYGAQAGAGYA